MIDMLSKMSFYIPLLSLAFQFAFSSVRKRIEILLEKAGAVKVEAGPVISIKETSFMGYFKQA